MFSLTSLISKAHLFQYVPVQVAVVPLGNLLVWCLCYSADIYSVGTLKWYFSGEVRISSWIVALVQIHHKMQTCLSAKFTYFTNVPNATSCTSRMYLNWLLNPIKYKVFKIDNKLIRSLKSNFWNREILLVFNFFVALLLKEQTLSQ